MATKAPALQTTEQGQVCEACDYSNSAGPGSSDPLDRLQTLTSLPTSVLVGILLSFFPRKSRFTDRLGSRGLG